MGYCLLFALLCQAWQAYLYGKSQKHAGEVPNEIVKAQKATLGHDGFRRKRYRQDFLRTISLGC
jgi:hypothetical protein